MKGRTGLAADRALCWADRKPHSKMKITMHPTEFCQTHTARVQTLAILSQDCLDPGRFEILYIGLARDWNQGDYIEKWQCDLALHLVCSLEHVALSV